MKRIDSHISRTILASTGMVALVIAALVLLLRIIREADNVGMGDYGWPEMLVYVTLKTPSDMLLVVPVVVLLGALMALGGLAANRELVVFRSAGVSMLRLVRAVSHAGLVLAILTALVGNYLGPEGRHVADHLRQASRGDTAALSLKDGVWLRQGEDVLRIGGILPDNTLTDVTIYELDGDGHLATAMHAKRARQDRQGIIVYQPQVTHISIDGTRTPHPQSLHVDVHIDPDILKLAVVDPDDLSLPLLWRYIGYLQHNRVNADSYRLEFWRRVVTPFTVWLLTVFALPFAFGSLRGAGAGQRLFLGGLAGLLFYLVNGIVAASGMVYGLPAWLAASLPTLLLGAGTVAWIRRLS